MVFIKIFVHLNALSFLSQRAHKGHVLKQLLFKVLQAKTFVLNNPLAILFVIHFFFYKDLFYKKILAEICQFIKNMLRT